MDSLEFRLTEDDVYLINQALAISEPEILEFSNRLGKSQTKTELQVAALVKKMDEGIRAFQQLREFRKLTERLQEVDTDQLEKIMFQSRKEDHG
jgi:hypothetical protein